MQMQYEYMNDDLDSILSSNHQERYDLTFNPLDSSFVGADLMEWKGLDVDRLNTFFSNEFQDVCSSSRNTPMHLSDDNSSIDHQGSLSLSSVQDYSASLDASVDEDSDNEEIVGSKSAKSCSSKKVKRERNKVSASKYRQKKKEYVQGLEVQVATLTTQLSQKESQVRSLEAENKLLKEQIGFLQKLFQSMSPNSSNSSTVFTLGVVLLFAFILPFNFGGSSSGLQQFSPFSASQKSNDAMPISNQRKILTYEGLDSLKEDNVSTHSAYFSKSYTRYYTEQDYISADISKYS